MQKILYSRSFTSASALDHRLSRIVEPIESEPELIQTPVEPQPIEPEPSIEIEPEASHEPAPAPSVPKLVPIATDLDQPTKKKRVSAKRRSSEPLTQAELLERRLEAEADALLDLEFSPPRSEPKPQPQGKVIGRLLGPGIYYVDHQEQASFEQSIRDHQNSLTPEQWQRWMTDPRREEDKKKLRVSELS